jgi:hypothetical protein
MTVQRLMTFQIRDYGWVQLHALAKHAYSLYYTVTDRKPAGRPSGTEGALCCYRYLYCTCIAVHPHPHAHASNTSGGTTTSNSIPAI